MLVSYVHVYVPPVWRGTSTCCNAYHLSDPIVRECVIVDYGRKVFEMNWLFIRTVHIVTIDWDGSNRDGVEGWWYDVLWAKRTFVNTMFRLWKNGFDYKMNTVNQDFHSIWLCGNAIEWLVRWWWWRRGRKRWYKHERAHKRSHKYSLSRCIQLKNDNDENNNNNNNNSKLPVIFGAPTL